MGLSRTSALMIQGNKTKVKTYSNKEKTGYGFIIYLMRGEDIHTEIVSTLPHFPYESKKMAKSEGKNLVEKVKELKL